MAKILIAGCGYVGEALGKLLLADGHEVWGLRRNPRSLPAGIASIAADLTQASDLRDLPAGLDCVFYLVSPNGSEDALYRHAYVDGLRGLLAALERHRQRPRLLFASSTAVYWQRHGEWVDEESETAPEHWSGTRILEGERLALGSLPSTTVVRFGGIYGPRRTRLIDCVRSGRATYRDDPPHYTNRIHRDDCAGALRHLMSLDAPESIYLAVDNEPVEERTLLLWLAGVMGSPEPRAAEGHQSEKRPRGNKRCRNARLVRSGYKFRYPTFREGYSAVLEQLV
ncbi:MAG TPA: SDR family oxidoreductase [Myxococcota bacterium]|nr:SDR family oxidoreductase [Myxococcota bacterium]